MKIKTLVFALLSCLCLQATAQEDIIDRLNKTLSVRLPAEYEAKVRSTARSNETMRKALKVGGRFTEEFIIKQMSTSWGIDKQNQLIFVWSAIYEKFTKQELYDGSDGDDKRLNDFGEIIDQWESCGKTFAAEFNAEMERVSAEARKHSAEVIKSSVKELVRFFNIYKETPNVIRKEEHEQSIEFAKFTIANCKKRDIDYHAILLKELGDEKKVDELLKYFDVE